MSCTWFTVVYIHLFDAKPAAYVRRQTEEQITRHMRYYNHEIKDGVVSLVTNAPINVYPDPTQGREISILKTGLRPAP